MNKKTKVIIIITSIITALLLVISFIISVSSKKQETSQEGPEVRLMANTTATTEEELYECATKVTFTKNIDKEKALEALKPYIMFYNDQPIHYTTEVKLEVCDDNTIGASVDYPNGKHTYISTPYKEIDGVDGMEYAIIQTWMKPYYACVFEKTSVTKDSDLTKAIKDVMSTRYNTGKIGDFTIDYNDSLQAECETWTKTTLVWTMDVGDPQINVRILDNLTVDTYVGNGNTDEYVAPDDYEVPTEPNMPNPNDKTDELDEGSTNIITDTINKIKENDAAKITTGIISCILGVGIIYVIYIIIRKLFRCLRK